MPIPKSIGRKGRAVAAGALCFAIWSAFVLLTLEIAGRMAGGDSAMLLSTIISLSVFILPAFAALVSGVAHTYASSELPKPDLLNRLVEALLFSMAFIAITFAMRVFTSGANSQSTVSESDILAAIGTGIYSLFFFMLGGYFTEGSLAGKRHDAPEAF